MLRRSAIECAPFSASLAVGFSTTAACARGVTADCRRRVETLRKVLDAAAALGAGDSVAAASASVETDKAQSLHKPSQSRSN